MADCCSADCLLLSSLLFVVSQLIVVCCCRFINARRRIVQPMIDQSNRAGKSTPKTFRLSHRVMWSEHVEYDFCVECPLGKECPYICFTFKEKDKIKFCIIRPLVKLDEKVYIFTVSSHRPL